MNENETRKEISRRLVDLRNKKGTSVGIGRNNGKFPQSTMWEWEENVPKALARLKLLAEWYEVSADYIITLIDKPLPIEREQFPFASHAVDEIVHLMWDLPEGKQRAIVEIAKVVAGL